METEMIFKVFTKNGFEKIKTDFKKIYTTDKKPAEKFADTLKFVHENTSEHTSALVLAASLAKQIKKINGNIFTEKFNFFMNMCENEHKDEIDNLTEKLINYSNDKDKKELTGAFLYLLFHSLGTDFFKEF